MRRAVAIWFLQWKPESDSACPAVDIRDSAQLPKCMCLIPQGTALSMGILEM